MTFAIDVGVLFRLVIRRWPILLLILVVSLTFGYFKSSVKTSDVYQAKTIIYCTGQVISEIDISKKVVLTNLNILNSEKVARNAALRLSIKIPTSSLRKSVRMFSKLGSAVYHVIAISSYPDVAIEISNAMADAFIGEVSGQSGRVVVYEYASSAKMIKDGKKSNQSNMLLIPSLSIFLAILGIVAYFMAFGRVHSVAESVLYDRNNIFGVICKNNK